jgi:hypothetical protein
LAIQLIEACTVGWGVSPRGEVLKISSPSGRPSATTMPITMPTIAAVCPSAGSSSEETSDQGVAVAMIMWRS